jgi:hypothetical protein
MAWYVCLSLNQFKNPVVNLIFESSLTLRKATLLVSVTDGRITKPTGKLFLKHQFYIKQLLRDCEATAPLGYK